MSNCKLVTYDLVKPETDYEDLIDAIKGYSDWCTVQKSVWLISSNDTCETIRDHLKKYMDDDDRLFVAELPGEVAWHKVICSHDDVHRLLGA